jgi:hypothetical protein
VAEPLEEFGIHNQDMQTFLVCCIYAMKSIAIPTRGHRINAMPPSGGGATTILPSENTGYSANAIRVRTDSAATTGSTGSHSFATSASLPANPGGGISANQFLPQDALPTIPSSKSVQEGLGGIVRTPTESSENEITITPHTSSLGYSGFGYDKTYARAEILRRDWIRFITCCRLCLQQLAK